MVKLNSTDPEEKTAKAALFRRHPSFSKMPAGHGFFVAKFELDGIWLISAYGGAKVIKPADYLKGSGAAYRSALVPLTRDHLVRLRLGLGLGYGLGLGLGSVGT